ncbi:MAG: glycosyltransferase [Bacillota bacterium]
MKRRILFVSTISSTVTAFLIPFAKYFRETGWIVDVLARNVTKQEGCQTVFDNLWDIKWSRNPFDIKNFINPPKFIQDLICNEKYDIIHVHTPVASFVTRYALRNFKDKDKPVIIYTAHGFHFHKHGSLLKNKLFLNLEKIAGKWMDYLIVINREDEEAAKKYKICPPSKIRYIPGIGIDTKLYDPSKISVENISQIRNELKLGSNDILFLMISEFNPGKRHRDLIKAFSNIMSPNVHLALAGIGSMQNKIMELVKKLRIDNRVHFLGFRNDIPVLIRASRATILPSEREGLPRSIMESLSLEVPVIGSNIRGIQELLEGNCGLLINTGNIDCLTNAMRWIIDHESETKEMGKNGRIKMQGLYKLSNILKAHEELYTEAVGRKIKR